MNLQSQIFIGIAIIAVSFFVWWMQRRKK